LAQAARLAQALLVSAMDHYPEERPVHFSLIGRWSAAVLLACASLVAMSPTPSMAQGELTRKVKFKVAPEYPELARRMNLRGTVKVLVVVAPSGNLKDTKVMGGNPILVNAAIDALKKWKFEPGTEESSGTVEFKFEPSE
jgi:TonB family protein